VKFLVDAQLPRALSHWLTQSGHDSIHTLDLPDQNLTTDSEILALSMREQRMVITKDSDFLDNFIVRRQPHKLLLVTTGNIPNRVLLNLFQKHLPETTGLLDRYSVVELTRTQLIAHL